MRVLTLIVTDCHAPTGLGHEILGTIERLPTAELVLARGTRRGRCVDWWQAVFATVGAGAVDANVAVASVAWFGSTGQRADNLWLATPVRFTAAMDHVRLDSVGVPTSFRLDSLCDEFNRAFGGAGPRLQGGTGGHLFLEVSRALDATSVDPGRIVGGDLADGLPSGPDSPYLRRLMTEIQMWLHSRLPEGSPFNALWLWGGGGTWPDLKDRVLPTAASDEPLVHGLWRLSGAESSGAPANFMAARNLAAKSLFVTLSLERWRAEGEQQPLQRLEREWLAPAWSALAAGQLHAFGLGLNGILSRVTRAESWRIWRTRRHWAES